MQCRVKEVQNHLSGVSDHAEAATDAIKHTAQQSLGSLRAMEASFITAAREVSIPTHHFQITRPPKATLHGYQHTDGMQGRTWGRLQQSHCMLGFPFESPVTCVQASAQAEAANAVVFQSLASAQTTHKDELDACAASHREAAATLLGAVQATVDQVGWKEHEWNSKSLLYGKNRQSMPKAVHGCFQTLYCNCEIDHNGGQLTVEVMCAYAGRCRSEQPHNRRRRVSQHCGWGHGSPEHRAGCF